MSKRKGKKNKFPTNTKKAAVEITRSESFSGPLPPPSLLQQYDNIVPGAAKIIFDKFEQQSNHRVKIESSVVTAANRKELLGLVLGFIIAMTTILGGIYTVLQGYTFLGGGLSFTGLALIVVAFVTGKKGS